MPVENFHLLRGRRSADHPAEAADDPVGPADVKET